METVKGGEGEVHTSMLWENSVHWNHVGEGVGMRRGVGKCMLDGGSNGIHWWSRSGHCEVGIG